ncbi:MAG: 1-(5-phosphoribosyl)-5-[(5-phosphoribosylamino)methylideneamino]imidazole-4-carboxamide isomerase [Ruminococcaceae bacterium]|nr:1-(5-phosphoribosyl)-5-[(5-phosphoribosylamino)methylideneamino]imidazole-4-carboxamide isomerase [Oscillospiraceae bacterium]
MNIFPAIDLYEGKAVRLYKGDYNQMTVYSENPLEVAKKFEALGATHLHLVDLEGAKNGHPGNLDVIRRIVEETDLFTEVGGGIRTIETAKAYIESGVDRIILGTAAVENEEFLKEALSLFKDKVAVGVDIKDGFVAIKGWTEKSAVSAENFMAKMESLGVTTVICTDISRDGAMQGSNNTLYKELSEKFNIDLVASGGVSDINDIKTLAAMNLYGAIIGKAYYIGAINLEEAIEVAK